MELEKNISYYTNGMCTMKYGAQNIWNDLKNYVISSVKSHGNQVKDYTGMLGLLLLLALLVNES